MKIILEKKHRQWGLTAFLVILCSLVVFFAIYKLDSIAYIFHVMVGVLAPIIYGLVMAYLLCPIYNFTVSKSYSALTGGKYRFKHDMMLSKVIGTIVSTIILLVVIGGVLWMIIPGLLESVIKVIEMLPSGLENFTAWVDVKFAKLPLAKETIDDFSEKITAYLIDYVTNTFLPKSGSVVASVSGTIFGAFNIIFDFIIGIIVCIYFLNIKDTLSAQAKKIIIANFREDRAEEILSAADYTNRTFAGFISGKLIDSAIIGILCFIVMSIFGWEYSLLISCIIGITNIIPFFGPFIGAIPSAMLLLIVNPMHCLYFVILVVILQLFDGNILGPKILGETTGLASFWVLFAVLVGGGLFGFIGMVVSIPVFAVIYAYCARALNRRLEKKGFSTNTLDYKVDKYRNREPKKKRGKPTLDRKKAAENPLRKSADEVKSDMSVPETTDEEIKQAEEKGQVIMQATLVEFHDSESEGDNEGNNKAG